MNLTLVTEGSFLHVKDRMIEVQVAGRKQRVSPQKVERILITTGLRLTSDLVLLALEHKIDILFLDRFGNPAGRVWLPAIGSTGRIRKQQLHAALDRSGLHFVIEWVTAKIQNRILFLEELAGKRKARAPRMQQWCSAMKAERDKIKNIHGSRDHPEGSIRGHEGTAGKAYFACLQHIQPKPFPFDGRSFRPARDPFNCLLNYGYGVLYGYIEKACHVAGLDPHIGFLHRDGYRQRSFVFDFIEPYRHHVERVVAGLFYARKVKKAFFEPLANGVVLNKEGKRLLLEHLGEAFDRKTRTGDRRVQLKHVFQLDAHRFAARLLAGAPPESENLEDFISC